MADTKTQEQTATQAGPAPMQEQGMPDGQAPATQGQQQREAPKSPNQQRAELRAVRMAQMVTAIEKNRDTLEAVLRGMGLPFDTFRAAAIIGLKSTLKNDAEFFEMVPVAAYFEEVQKAAFLGLMPDGKQCAIARFKDQAQLMVMVDGYVKILFETGLVKDINHNLVLREDQFEFMEGSDPWVEHKPDLDGDPNAPNADIRAAWCFVNTIDGGKFLEITRKADLLRIAAVSRSTKGPRASWGGEMHRKAPFRRLLKRLPHHPKLQALIQAEDATVDLDRPATVEDRRAHAARAITNDGLFEDTRATVPPIESDEENPAADDHSGVSDDDADFEDTTVAAAAIAEAREAKNMAGTAAARLAWTESEAFASASAETKAWVDEAFEKRIAELEADQPFQLQAIISSTTGVKTYEDPDLWASDILTKLAAVTGDARKAFLKRNLQFILSARDKGVAQAERVLATTGQGDGQ